MLGSYIINDINYEEKAELLFEKYYEGASKECYKLLTVYDTINRFIT